MDFGYAQKESIEGSDAKLLKGTINSSSFLQHNDVEAMISHNKSEKDANLNVIAQGISLMLLSIFSL